MMKNGVLLLVIGLLFSCQNEKSNEDKTFELIPSGKFLSLDLDDSTANISTGLQYFKGDKEYLFNANWGTNSLQIYDLQDQKLAKELFFDFEGPNGIGGLFGFHVQSMDSIFLFTAPFGSRFFIVDSEGEIEKRIDYQIPEGLGSFFVHNAYMLSPPVIQGGSLAANTRFSANIREVTQALLSSKNIGIEVDLNTGESKPFAHFFPSDYLASGQKMIDLSRAQGKDKIVYSFFGDHQLYYSSAFDLPLRPIQAASSYLENNMPAFQSDSPSEFFFQYNLASSRYGSLLYDSFRNVYYRFAFPTIPDVTEEDLRNLRTSPGPFVVMVFDENLKLLTEKLFEAGTYLPDNSFVGEKGLYLSINHPDNPQNKEDQMVFELIEFREME
jgi:hypothetical protein